ncbi:hypothetical protein I3760_12G006800 [Carya illinoinensis]|nr:hypothetical protein I3760_12G006800 [Carya illinoinensis]
MNLGDTIKEGNQGSLQDCAKAMIFLQHHLHEELKTEYLTVKDPLILWNDLREDMNIRKLSLLKLCGEKVTDDDLLEKHILFSCLELLLQQQYRERKFKKYSELISCILLAEQNNELLLRNHQSRPTGSISFPEVNGTRFISFPEANGKTIEVEILEGKGPQNKFLKKDEDGCHRCGMIGHWARICRTDKHLVDLYQYSIKEKTKKFETNFTEPSYALDSIDGEDITSLDVSDFFEILVVELIMKSKDMYKGM